MKVFIENQKFTQLWIHILLVVSFCIPLILVFREWMRSNYEDEESKIALFVVIGSILLIYAFILSLKLKSRIDENGIHFRFIPFQLKTKLISWEEIEKIYTRKYNAVYEYGGWGVKGGKLWRKSNGISYSVTGNKGLQIELKNGKKILIGTQKEKDLNRVLQSYHHKIEKLSN